MKRWQFWVGVLIGAACVGWAVSQVEDWGEFRQALQHQANWVYVIPIIAGYFAVMFLRAVRWRFILSQCGRASLSSTWTSTLVCYMGNNIFPLRAGEFMRVFMIGKLEPSITFSSGLATVVVERLFDFLSVLVMLGMVLALIEFPEGGLMFTAGGEQYNMENLINNLGRGTLFGAVVLFIFLFLLYIKTDIALKVAGFFMKPLPDAFSAKLLDMLRTFSSGLTIMGRPKALFTVAGLSAVTWSINLIPVWLTGLALGFSLSIVDVLFLMMAGAAAASIPGPPGFLGTFHAINQKAFTFLTEASGGVALLFAIILHACYYVPITIAGVIAAKRAGFSVNRLREESEEIEENTEPESDCKSD